MSFSAVFNGESSRCKKDAQGSDLLSHLGLPTEKLSARAMDRLSVIPRTSKIAMLPPEKDFVIFQS